MKCLGMNGVESFSYKDDKAAAVEEFKKIAKREGKDKSKLLVELIEDYVKAHSSGNPVFTLDNWKDPNFQAVPAFYADIDTWVNVYKNSNDKDKTKLRIRNMELAKKFRMVDINS